jgi:hypothetical protein
MNDCGDSRALSSRLRFIWERDSAHDRTLPHLAVDRAVRIELNIRESSVRQGFGAHLCGSLGSWTYSPCKGPKSVSAR